MVVDVPKDAKYCRSFFGMLEWAYYCNVQSLIGQCVPSFHSGCHAERLLKAAYDRLHPQAPFRVLLRPHPHLGVCGSRKVWGKFGASCGVTSSAQSHGARTKQEQFPGFKSGNIVIFHSTGRVAVIAFPNHCRIDEMRQRSGWFVTPYSEPRVRFCACMT